MKQFFSIIAVLAAIAFFATDSGAQTTRSSVSASEVNGTFRSYFKGKYKGSYNEAQILALGGGKLKIALGLTYPYTTGNGELSANVGELTGIADIAGDTAVYTSEEFGTCKITIKFVRPGTIRISQEGGSNCGFGHNVMVDGTYARSSKAKPRFDSNL